MQVASFDAMRSDNGSTLKDRWSTGSRTTLPDAGTHLPAYRESATTHATVATMTLTRNYSGGKSPNSHLTHRSHPYRTYDHPPQKRREQNRNSGNVATPTVVDDNLDLDVGTPRLCEECGVLLHTPDCQEAVAIYESKIMSYSPGTGNKKQNQRRSSLIKTLRGLQFVELGQKYRMGRKAKRMGVRSRTTEWQKGGGEGGDFGETSSTVAKNENSAVARQLQAIIALELNPWVGPFTSLHAVCTVCDTWHLQEHGHLFYPTNLNRHLEGRIGSGKGSHTRHGDLQPEMVRARRDAAHGAEHMVSHLNNFLYRKMPRLRKSATDNQILST
ncbi:hypothetical protein FISHEDRAFT_70324 [Fistulina hepatica ATCC 64428]|uniref:Uncharacterized protein n=1 Tax=Fistulina hepatica ATCC 64428 TaxID=1128425 RepID=A0A0D7AKH3_9AGAR|nr:hypothetical protein FISHEDRAFT_70324 [Fistulina hepatica ATCC 64428]